MTTPGAWQPVPAIEAWAEAFSVPPLMHVTTLKPIKVLTQGQFSLPLAKLALRYPNTVEVHIVGSDTTPKDRRVHGHARLEDLPTDFLADIVGIAVPGDPTALLPSLKKHMAPDAIVVVGVDLFNRGRVIKDAMNALWRQVLVYREHAPDPSLFIMGSDRVFGATMRPFPPGLQRLNPRYLRSLFELATDEARLLFGQKVA